MQNPASDTELREFFGEAKDGIMKVHFPISTFAGRSNKLAYVEFGDEEAMKAGLEKHAEVW
jgi:RNA recognition motif-containing protein